MNGKQVAQVIASTCRDLFALNLVGFHNPPCEVTAGGRTRVSWPNAAYDAANDDPFGSLEQYLGWVRNGEFTCLLFDSSLIRASYDCVGNTIVGHSLLYWPCPVEFLTPVDRLQDLCDGLEMCMNSPCKSREVCRLTLRTPMRFDFDPDDESEDHPLVHLHTQFEDARIYVQEAMCFPAFIKKVFRTFYFTKWAAHAAVQKFHEQAIEHEDGQFGPAAHCFQLSWR